ncbi:ankyrin repeat domain-containing protein [Pseudoxanthomonas winnipegensis]|uniref:Ankyrin repeat domain-containing protein n=1 Tax=Pseudoxanthomonas winnipegensis TaxID=2480810 RepID=A0A4Q8M2Z3_9GAMM|nr:ankyrin repeat domain-containing protein [Pseudoxanthomonas winnipegensis]TAA41577.1 ankyrin repeat domain-containing protein [Pseudoxanthomonas winnipegensis]
MNATQLLIRTTKEEDYQGVEAALAQGGDPNVQIQRIGPLMNIAAGLDKTGIITQLIKANADVNAGANVHLGMRPLHIAVRECKAIMVRILLKAGADVNAQDLTGCTPLHIAMLVAEQRQQPMICDLMNAGADPSIRAGNGMTPLEYAKFLKRPKVIIDLMETYSK